MARLDLVNVCKSLKDRDGGAFASSFVPPLPRLASRSGSAGFAIENLNLMVPDGKTMVILGPSGCGKTTLLKIIAGLIAPDSGDVRYNGVNVTEVAPGERRIGMVFQNYALYPHMVSKANVMSYFLFKKKTPELTALAQAKYQRTSELMGVELAHLLDRKPGTLSGGEKQRVALGRCITRDPALFLLDEPFSNLDQALREKYRVNLKILLRQFDITTVYVTHDHYEALILGDLQIGVRPEDIEISREEQPEGAQGVVTGKVSLPLLKATSLRVKVADREVYAEMPGDVSIPAGKQVWLTFKRYHVFDRASGTRLRSVPEFPSGAG